MEYFRYSSCIGYIIILFIIILFLLFGWIFIFEYFCKFYFIAILFCLARIFWAFLELTMLTLHFF